MPTLGTAAGTANHNFYWIERVGGDTVLNRVFLDETKMYTGSTFAQEIETKMNAGSISGSAVYTVTFDTSMNNMVFELSAGSTHSFYLVNDDLLADPAFQVALPAKTGANQDDWAPNFRHLATP